MAVSHVKSNPVANMTGTVTVFNSAGITTTANATDLVRPADWNSAHNQYITISGNAPGNTTASGTNIVFQGAGGVSLFASTDTLIWSGPQFAVSAQGASISNGTLIFSNSNGVTFGQNGSTVTASHNGLTTAAQSNHSHGNPTLALTNLSGTTASNSAGLTLSLSAAAPGGGGGIGLSAGTQSVSTGTVAFANSNGITFGMSGSSQITASHNGLTTAAQSNHSHGNPNLALTNLSGTTASNSAGLTLSLSAAAPGGAASGTFYATGNTTQSSTGSIALSSVILRGDGGVSAGVSNGSLVVSGPALTSLSVTGALSASSNGSTISLGVGTVTASAAGNTTQGSSGTLNLNGLVIQGTGGASVGISNGSLVISGATGGAGGGVAVANSQTTYTSGTVNLSAAGALTIESTTGQSYRFSVPNTSSLSAVGNLTISTNGNTISFSVGTAAAAPVEVSAGTTSGSLSRIQFADSNGMTFGLNGSTITASHNGLTTAAQSNHSHGNPTLALTNLSGTTASNSAGLTLSLSAAAPGGGGAALSAGTQSANTGTINFANSNGITFGMSGSSQITASHNGITTARASNDAIGLNSAFTAGPLAMTINSAGLSLNAASAAGTTSGFTGGASISGSMTHNTAGLALSLSHPAWLTTAALSNHSHGNPTLALTNLSATTASNSAGLTLSLSAAAPGGGGGVGLSAGTQSVSTGTVAFANSNGITFGMSGSNQITASYNSTQFAGTGTSATNASITLNSNGLAISVAAPGAAAEQNAINLLGANTSGNTTATGSTIGLSGINMTLSGTNASQIVMSVPATSSLVGAGGITVSSDGSTISISNSAVMNNYRAFEKGNNTSFSSFGQNTVHFQHFIPEDVIQFSFIELWARGSFVSSSNSAAYSQTIRYGLYSNETGANSTRMTQMASSSVTMGVSFNSNTAAGITVGDGVTSYTTTSGGTGIISRISGPFHLYLPYAGTLQPNVKHAVGIAISSTTAVNTQAWRFAPMVQTVMNSLSMGRMFASGIVAPATTVIGDREMGVYSVTSGALPVSYATSQISIAVSRQQLPFMLEG